MFFLFTFLELNIFLVYSSVFNDLWVYIDGVQLLLVYIDGIQ